MIYRDVRYARASDGAYIAYVVLGDGPIDVVVQFDWPANLDLLWEAAPLAAWLDGIASFSRMIVHDRRGTGLSTRNVSLPNLETRVSDLKVVLDEIGSERPALFGMREGGAPNAMLAATDPARVRSLVWGYPSPRSVWAPDYPWGAKPDYVELDQAGLELWGTHEYGKAIQAQEAVAGHVIPDDRLDVAVFLTRQTATPDVAKELSRIWYETDVRALLPSIQAPTLLLSDGSETDEVDYVASRIPDASTFIHPIEWTLEDAAAIPSVLEEVRRFLGVEPPVPELDTVLSTVLFTDIVGSTEKQAALGDHAWKDLIQKHHSLVRDTLVRWRGVENDTAGDGFYATFDGPARAIRAAMEIRDRVRELGIEVRAGVHTGECELMNDKVGGIAVTIGARISVIAGPSEVLISQTVKDLVAGSGLTFEDFGEHELKGIPGHWHLYRVGS